MKKDQNHGKLHFSINIRAPKERVWETMLNEKTYKEWTSAFTEGSHYKGNWNEGSKILFLDPNGEGMVSRIEKNEPYKYISIEHLGFVVDGTEDLESDGAKYIAGAHENYTFRENSEGTEILVDLDIDENNEYKAMFENTWPKALLKLKKLCEDK